MADAMAKTDTEDSFNRAVMCRCTASICERLEEAIEWLESINYNGSN